MSSIDIDEVLQDGNLDDLLTLHAAGASDSLYIMNSLFNNNAFDFHLLTDSKKLPRNWRLAFLHIIEVWFMSSKDESKVTSSHLSVLSELVRLDLIDPRNIIPDLVVHLIEGNDVWRNNLLSNPRTSAVRGLEKYMALSNADAITTCEMLKCGQGDPLKMLRRQKLQGFINRYPEILIYLASHPSLEDDNAFWKFLNLIRSVDMPMILDGDNSKAASGLYKFMCKPRFAIPQMTPLDRTLSLFRVLLGDEMSYPQYQKLQRSAFCASTNSDDPHTENFITAVLSYFHPVFLDKSIRSKTPTMSKEIWLLLAHASKEDRDDIVDAIISHPCFDYSRWLDVLPTLVKVMEPELWTVVWVKLTPPTLYERKVLGTVMVEAVSNAVERGNRVILKGLLDLVEVWDIKGRKKVASELSWSDFLRLHQVNAGLAGFIRNHRAFCQYL